MRAPRRKTLATVLLDGFAKAFVNDIHVSITLEDVSFRQGQNTLSFKPLVVVSRGPTPKIVAVGERVPVTEPVTEVNLFDCKSLGSTPEEKYDCLERFFRYAFRLLSKRSTVLRPRVVISATPELSTALCGYEGALLTSACLSAGARECVFRAA
jgi:hypothetical protein